MYIEKLDLDIKDFTAADIVDMDIVVENATTESQKIYDNPSTRKGRTFDEIYRVSLQSHIAEKHLIEKYDFDDDPRPYMDVIYNGQTIDVKTSINGIMNYKQKHLETLAEKNLWPNVVITDYVMGFDVKNEIYEYKFYEKVPTVTFTVIDNVKASVVGNDIKGFYNQLKFNDDYNEKQNKKYSHMNTKERHLAMLTSFGIKVSYDYGSVSTPAPISTPVPISSTSSKQVFKKRPKFVVINKSLTKKINYTPEILYNGLIKNGKTVGQAISIMRDYGIKVV